MKTFLAVVAGAALTFIAVSVVQERETFSRDWFKAPQVDPGSKEERRAAADAVYLFRTVASHFYSSSGDPRFAERLPASEPIVRELQSEVAYVKQNGRIESPRLVRIEFLTSEVTEHTRAEVTTREYWVTSHQWIAGGQSDPTRSDIGHFRYRLTVDGNRWLITSWDPIEGPQEPAR